MTETILAHSACMYYRHDYGLMDDGDQARLRREAEEWRYAWQKVDEDGQPGTEPPRRALMETLIPVAAVIALVAIVFATGFVSRGVVIAIRLADSGAM